MNSLGLIYRRTHRFDKAETIHRQEWAISKRVLGANHPETLVTMLNLSRVLAETMQLDKASAMIADARARVREALPDIHPLTAAIIMLQGEIALAKGKYDVARERYDEALLIYLTIHDQEHPRVTAVEEKIAALPT